MRGRASPSESRGPRVGSGKSQRNVATIVASTDDEFPTEVARREKRERVLQLREELQQAEVEESLAEAVATLCTLTPGKGPSGATLGPTLSATVSFEGVPVSALLDSGSPVTIVSLSFLLQALKQQRATNQTPEDWAAAVRHRLQPPSLNLSNYGGDQLSVI